MEGSSEMKKVLSEEDLARAKQKMRERDRHLTQVCENVKSRFMTVCPLHAIHLIWQRDVDFRTYVFLKTDADVEFCKSNGTTAAIEAAVYEELERYGRGKRGEIVVAFEFDSHENVEKKFKGDYLLRLR